jgi:hypothetical protein
MKSSDFHPIIPFPEYELQYFLETTLARRGGEAERGMRGCIVKLISGGFLGRFLKRFRGGLGDEDNRN